MFTGLVAAKGNVLAVRKSGENKVLEVGLGDLGRPFPTGASIALSGVCCTVTRMDGATAHFDLSPETLRRTWLDRAEPGTPLNLEPALCAGDPLGGHLVQGHVDGVGHILEPVDDQGGEWWVEIPRDLSRYCVEKGSITLDGISLTIAAQQANRVMIAIIPHTAQATTIAHQPKGTPLHVEVDVLAKYVERMVAPWQPNQP